MLESLSHFKKKISNDTKREKKCSVKKDGNLIYEKIEKRNFIERYKTLSL